jgi:AMMECR1 domain-containing protein
VPVDQGWTREQMLDQLCRKAGLEAGEWRSGAELHRFRSEKFREADFREPPRP